MASTNLDDSTVEWEFIVSRIRYLFIDHTTWPGDPGDPDRWECPATTAPSHLRNPDADSAPDWAHPDLVTQGAVQGLRVPRDQQKTGAYRTTQTPLWCPQYLQGHCAVVIYQDSLWIICSAHLFKVSDIWLSSFLCT